MRRCVENVDGFSGNLRVVLHLAAGGAVALTSLLADSILAQPHAWGLMQSIGLVTGLGIIGFGFVHPADSLSRLSTNLCLSLLSVFVFLAVGEGFFRVILFDFADEARAWHRMPPYYRMPIVPSGQVFFRRPGPEHWTGRALNTLLNEYGVSPNPYTNEAVITVHYDRRGFRNPDTLTDWGIAIAGDSFTELGYLTYPQLFTSVLARTLRISVLNLGASYTGPLTQLSYLHDYGVSAGTKHTMIMFFEGNDLADLAEEYAALARWRETGKRSYREFRKQPSLVRSLYSAGERVGDVLLNIAARHASHSGESNYITATFQSPQGDIPVTLRYAPPDRSQLSKETMQRLDYFFKEYAAFGKDRKITAWLAYVPAKERVLHGQLNFSGNAAKEFRNWRPTDLPEVISELCAQHGIRFVDLTPTLVSETLRRQQLLYNSIYDSHFNAQGCVVIGQELARHFSGLNLRSPNRALRPAD